MLKPSSVSACLAKLDKRLRPQAVEAMITPINHDPVRMGVAEAGRDRVARLRMLHAQMAPLSVLISQLASLKDKSDVAALNSLHIAYQAVIDSELSWPTYPAEQLLKVTCLVSAEAADWIPCKRVLGLLSSEDVSDAGDNFGVTLGIVCEKARATVQSKVYTEVVLHLLMKSEAKYHQICAHFVNKMGAEGVLDKTFQVEVSALMVLAKAASVQADTDFDDSGAAALVSAKDKIVKASRFGCTWDVYPGMVVWGSVVNAHLKRIETKRTIVAGFETQLTKCPDIKILAVDASHETTIAAVKLWRPYASDFYSLKSRVSSQSYPDLDAKMKKAVDALDIFID